MLVSKDTLGCYIYPTFQRLPGYGLSSLVVQPSSQRLCVRRRLPRSCRWSTCVAQRSQRHAHIASGPSVRTSSTVSTTKQKVGSGGDCRAQPRQQTRLPPGEARSAPGRVSASRPRRQAAGRPPGAAGRARAKQTASAQPRTCASTPLRAPASPQESAPLLLLLALSGARLKQRRVGAVRAHNLQLACPAPPRQLHGAQRAQRGDAPESRNCSRVCGRYQHASAKGECATSAT